MKYMLIVLGLLFMAEVVQCWGVHGSITVSIGKKRALEPQMENEVLVDARGVPVSEEVRQEITQDLQGKIKNVIEKERQKFGI